MADACVGRGTAYSRRAPGHADQHSKAFRRGKAIEEHRRALVEQSALAGGKGPCYQPRAESGIPAVVSRILLSSDYAVSFWGCFRHAAESIPTASVSGGKADPCLEMLRRRMHVSSVKLRARCLRQISILWTVCLDWYQGRRNLPGTSHRGNL